jgi:serpin B
MKTSYMLPIIMTGALLLLPACTPASKAAVAMPSEAPRDPDPQVADSDLSEWARGNSEFAFAMYREISSGGGNVFYSPYSMSIALAMTYSGSRNRTADQMAQALHFTLAQDRLHPALNHLALELASRAMDERVDPDQAFQLSIANSLWGQIDFHFEPDFLDGLVRNYGAGMRLVDFQSDPEAARVAINDWVSRETKEKVNDIIPVGVIKDITCLVLANAVYFKAAWQNPFPEGATQPGEFRRLDGTAVEAPMMRMQTNLRMMNGNGFRAVELPYAGGQLSMLILLPEEGRFDSVESGLDAGMLTETLAGLRPGQVLLTLPKFKFEWEAKDLPEDFKALGMTDAFSGAADFSGMTGKPELFIGAILHKAFVGVDEAGTEAAAATVVVMDRAAAPMDPVDFRIDRPFIFLIRDNPTGTILFLGRVTDPS